MPGWVLSLVCRRKGACLLRESNPLHQTKLVTVREFGPMFFCIQYSACLSTTQIIKPHFGVSDSFRWTRIPVRNQSLKPTLKGMESSSGFDSLSSLSSCHRLSGAARARAKHVTSCHVSPPCRSPSSKIRYLTMLFTHFTRFKCSPVSVSRIKQYCT